MQIGRAAGYLRERVIATRSLACALAVAGYAAAAQADGVTLDGMKDLIPSVSVAGITVYGVIDVGYGYQNHGLAFSGANYNGETYNVYGVAKGNIPAWSSLTNNGLSQSNIGVKVEEKLYGDWLAIGRLQSDFNPMSGEIGDQCASLVRAGIENVIGGRIETNGDGSRCGQAFNGLAYAGVTNSTYGTLTFGRQQSLDTDAMAAYDPMALSYAFSLIGPAASTGPGVGSTETARWDASVKYIFEYGPFHAAGMFASGTEGSSLHGEAGGANAGVTWQGFSFDAVYTNEHGAVNAITGAYPGRTVVDDSVVTTNSNALYYYMTDNEAWSLMAKYTFQFTDCCSWCCSGGGLKDEPPLGPKLTFYGGYQHVDQTQAGSTGLGGNTIGGYILFPLNFELLSTRVLQTEWGGAKLEVGPWVFTGAFYNFTQNNWDMNFLQHTTTLSAVGAPISSLAKAGTPGGCAVNAYTCSGYVDEESFLIQYIFNKNFDVYAGVAWSSAKGGLAHSAFSQDPFQETSLTSVVTGIRVKF
jgi:predicted porin